jgi:predicted alpha-1,6-mannanase (GH76 family)
VHFLPLRPHRLLAHLAGFVGVVVSLVLLFAGTAAFASPPVSNPDTRAALAVAQLHTWFNTSAYQTTAWWQSANALGATVDYMQGTGNRAYLTDVQSFYAAHSSTNFIVNKYYDDEGWWALTWIKAYHLTGNTAYLNTAKAIFANMTGGWDGTCGGGLWWTTDKTYKNAIPNELFLDIAAQLHRVTPGDTSYETWAAREWAWFHQSGMITSSNLVVDGLSSTCQPLLTSTTWTYNQGVILGGLVNQYQVTGDSTLLSTAQNIADAVIASPALSPNGILREPCEPAGTCGADGVMFKGIFAQNLNVLYLQTGTVAYQTYLRQNADSLWAHDVSGGDQIGLHWAGPFDSANGARQASGLDLLNTQIQARVNLTTTTAATVYSGMSGFCLDDKQDSGATNAIVELFTCNGTPAQQWQIQSNGKIQIAGACLDVYQNKMVNGALTVLYPCNNGLSQTWRVSSDGAIYNTQTGKCLDDPHSSRTDRTQLQIWTCNGASNQIWYLAS